MKILVPSDFSKLSNNAALYAAKFAKKINAEIILLHVVYIKSTPMAQSFGYEEYEIKDVLLSEATQECTHLVDMLKSKVKGLQISFKIIQGYPIEDVIESYVERNKIDLIVMGTKGASGFKKVLFGSNAVAVINRSSIPVLTVPKYSRFNHLKHIVYASDMHKLQSEIKKLLPLAKLFDAMIDILHVLPLKSKKKIDATDIKNKLVKKYKYKNISFNVSYNNDIIEGIDEFVCDIKAGILAIYTHEINFFEKLYKTTVAMEKAFHSSVPLLTFKK